VLYRLDNPVARTALSLDQPQKGQSMAAPDLTIPESDPRFPSGRWTGFFIQPWMPGRHTMNLDVTFQDGQMEARGSDWVGPFTFSGSYDHADGKCTWTKQYLHKHRVSYAGVNEGKGIWGVWEIRLLWGWYLDRGVFHIWPEGMAPDADADLTERALLNEVGRMPPLFLVVMAAALLLGLGSTLLIFHLLNQQATESLFR
jgi:hypothetical protein